MADKRRFNMGRQGEQFLDPNSFKAFNRIKYIGNGPGEPVQDKQAPMQDYSLWIDRSANSDVLKAYHQDTQIWKPMFEGYYHPANLKEQPLNPTEGQVFIDSNGTIRYYEDRQWKVASAASLTNLSTVAAGLSYFLLMPNMYPITGSQRNYLVPHIQTGKLFDRKYYMPDTSYEGSEISVVYPLEDGGKPFEKVSWVHVNPAFLYGTRKRLIKVITEIKKNNWFINVPTTNTEFYGFYKGEPYGVLLRYIQDYKNEDINSETTDTISDYRRVSGGIQLINDGRSYDYIYAITYNFDTVENDRFGNVLTGNVTIGDNNEVFVGQIRGVPLVFVDGTYLEQDDYTYDPKEGMLSFSGETITNEMDLVVAAFADVVRNTDTEYSNLEWMDKPIFEVTATSRNISGDTLTIQHEYLKQAAKFKHPIVFVQGVAGFYDPDYGFKDEVDIDADTGVVRVFDFGPIATDEEVKILVADIGDAKLSSGVVGKDLRFHHDAIDNNGKYLVFVNGICTAPSDHEVFTDYLTIAELDEEACVGMRYELMTLNQGDSGIDLLFDSKVSSFTFQIDDNNASNVYNDCDMAITYVYTENNFSDEAANGILIDKNHMQMSISSERAYAMGEILQVVDKSDESAFSYIYKIYNTDGQMNWKNFEDVYGYEEMAEMDSMITQFNGDGSISLISNDALKGNKLAYYAYTYANEMDEVIMSGKNNDYKIPFEEHRPDTDIPEYQDFYVSRTQIYTPPGKGILGTYVNGIQVQSTDSETVPCQFSIHTAESINFKKTWGHPADLYELLKTINDDTSMAGLARLKQNGKFVKVLQDYSVTESLLEGLKTLSRIIKESEAGNELFYYVEKMEAGEQMSVDRDWLSHGDRYTAFDNTYNAHSYIGPGAVDVYLNGVMLDRSSYSIFDNNNIILNDLMVAGGSDEYDVNDPETHTLIKYYVTEFDPEKNKMVGKIIPLHCTSPDEVLVEYRPDTSVKKVSYEIKDNTYDSNGVLMYEDYEFPNSLLKTKDVIKIWIDGILYTGGYHIEGKDIVLEDSPLRMDPIKQYFDANPDAYKAWKIEHGEYSYRKSRIIFEWR